MRALLTASVLVLMAACAADAPGATPAATADPADTTIGVTTTVTVVETTTTGVPLTTTPSTSSTSSLPTLSAGCGASSATPGESLVEFNAAGLDGTYIQHVPTSYDGVTPVPVVFGLHGWSQPAALLGVQSALPAAAERDGFVLLLPDITRPVPLWDTAVDATDAAWFGALLDEVEATLCVDTDQIFVTGMSNGAMMASTIVCRFAERIAAAAPVAGIRFPDGCTPARAVPIVAFHGTDDQFLAYEGGYGSSVPDLTGPDGNSTLGEVLASGPDAMPVPTRAAAWSALNGCADEVAESRIADDVVLRAHERCDAPVLLYTVENGGHNWPGSEFDQSISAIVGRTTTSIDATELMLAFFAESFD
jgi:polyhydroxybutyrate depolymerase